MKIRTVNPWGLISLSAKKSYGPPNVGLFQSDRILFEGATEPKAEIISEESNQELSSQQPTQNTYEPKI